MAASGSITVSYTFITLALFIPFGACLSANATGPRKSTVQQSVAVADIALAIDQSNSIRDHYAEELDFAKKFVNAFPVSTNETRIALLQFSFANMTKVRLPWSEGTSKEKVQSTVDSMKSDSLGAGTDFSLALVVALDELCKPEAGDRKDAPNVLVLVTDGYFSNPWEKKKSEEAASKLRQAGVLVYAIQVKTDPGLPVGDGPVQDLTLLTGNRSRVFSVENFDKLTNELLAQITQQISIEVDDCAYEYVPTGPCYKSTAGKCIVDGILKIDRHPSSPHGQPCPTANRTQIDCPREDGCKGGGNEENSVKPLPSDPQKEMGTGEASAGKALPFWAVVVIAVVGGVLLLLLVVAVIIARTPRWRAMFTPSKPGKPQLPGNSDDSLSTSASSSL